MGFAADTKIVTAVFVDFQSKI